MDLGFYGNKHVTEGIFEVHETALYIDLLPFVESVINIGATDIIAA